MLIATPAGSKIRGCSYTLANDANLVAGAGLAVVSFATKIYDTDGIGNVGDPSSFTIPANFNAAKFTGFFNCTGSVGSTGSFRCNPYLDGSSMTATILSSARAYWNPVAPYHTSLIVTSGWISVVAGNVFQFAFQQSDAIDHLMTATIAQGFALELGKI